MTILIGWSLKPIFLPLLQKCLPADPKHFGRAADLVMRGFERGGDYLAFDLFERAQTCNRTRSASRGGANITGKIFRFQNVRGAPRAAASGENDSTLDGVPQFANVARPGVRRQHAPRGITQFRPRAPVNGPQRCEQMVGEP